MGSTLGGLQDHLKLAREYALEGLYDTSIIFFDGALAQIDKYSLDHSLILSPISRGIAEEQLELIKQYHPHC